AAQIARKQPSAGESEAPLGGVIVWTLIRRRSNLMMDRRTFIGTCAGSLLAIPYIADAQQPPNIARIGYGTRCSRRSPRALGRSPRSRQCSLPAAEAPS